VLWMTFELPKLKAYNGWSDTSFSALLELLKPNGLPSSTYQAKKNICSLTLGLEKNHACSNQCILYRKEHEFKVGCQTCNASRYKQNDNNVEVQDDSNKKSNKRFKSRGAHGCGEQWNARDMRVYTGSGLHEDKNPMTCVHWLYYDYLG
jgi:hypothetical protein